MTLPKAAFSSCRCSHESH